MAMQTIEHEHHLSGNWTISGVVTQVDALSESLEKLLGGHAERLHVDCAKIDCIDMSGLQLLHVWMQCAKMRGIKTRLVNLSESMQQFIQRLGLNQSFTDNYMD